MTMVKWAPLAAVAALASLVACTSPAPEGLPSLALPSMAPADDLPVLVGAISPRPSPSRPPSEAPATLSSSRPGSPPPSPSPSPTPQLVEGDAFFWRVVPGWKVVTNNTKPVVIRLEASYGPASFTLTATPQEPNTTLEKRQTDARTGLGEGFVAQSAVTLDGVRGFLVSANTTRPEGKRFVVLRGFHYRSQYWLLESQWDKRSLEASRAEKDIDAMLKGFGWL